MDDFLKAGMISSQARSYAQKLIKEGLNLFDFAEKVEAKINELGGEPAFPINISIDEYAAHDTADYNDSRFFKEGQVVKVDLGAHVNGFVGDTAFTIEIGTKKYNSLIKASENAFWEALKVIKPGVKLGEVGSVIGETIKKAGFNPITNLGGHGVDEYDLHASLFIPNFDNKDKRTLLDGQMVAIEPFATTGKGFVVNSNTIKIHSIPDFKPVRLESARKISKFVKERFGTLPFSERCLYRSFSSAEVKTGISDLKRNNLLHSYPLLRESSGGIVSQYEHTIIVKDKPVVTTL